MIITQDNKLVTHFHGEVHPKQKVGLTNDELPDVFPNKNKFLIDFLEYEKTMGARNQQLIGLRVRVPKFFVYLDEKDLRLNEIKVKDALGYQGWLIKTGRNDGKPYSNNTILAFVASAASFYGYLKRQGIVHTNPFKEIRKVRAQKKLPREILREKQMDTFLEKLSHFEDEKNLKLQMTAYKIHVICELMYSTGLRIEEVSLLKTSDIDLARSLVEVREGKGGFPRIAFLNEYAREVLRIYLDRMRALVFSQWNDRNDDLLFGITRGRLGHMVNEKLKTTAIELDFPIPTSHCFRHALGFHLLRAGCNIRHIQQILGHKKLHNTEIYTKVEKEDLKKVMDRHHPRRWKKVSDEQTVN